MSIEIEEIEEIEDSENIIIERTSYENEFLVSRLLNFHRTSNAPEFIEVAEFICNEIGYTESRENKNLTHMLMLLADLYHCYKGYSKRYLRVRMTKNETRQKFIKRYNRQGIAHYPLTKCLRGLIREKYITKKKGCFSFDFGDGYLTRVRATEKLIHLLDADFNVDISMVHTHPNEELIIRRTPRVDRPITYKKRNHTVRHYMVKVKYLDAYRDNEHTFRWRKGLEQYNGRLSKIYADIDLRGYVHDADMILVDLSEKTVRRSFSNSSFTMGGRFYGGWWQKLPEALRERIILDGQHVVEVDFSGIMVHIIYAMKGLKLRTLDRNPYIYEKNNDPEQKREYIKKLMNVALNADEKTVDGKPKYKNEAVNAVFYAVKKDRKRKAGKQKFPIIYTDDSDLMTKLWAMLKEIEAYHPEMVDLFGSGYGVRTMFYDSQIAYKVINQMTAKGIPVLCVHDSFICQEQHVDLLKSLMSVAFVDVLNQVSHKYAGKREITLEDVGTKQSDIEVKFPAYMRYGRNEPWHLLNAVFSRDNDQYAREREWKATRRTNFNVTVEISNQGIVSKQCP